MHLALVEEEVLADLPFSSPDRAQGPQRVERQELEPRLLLDLLHQVAQLRVARHQVAQLGEIEGQGGAAPAEWDEKGLNERNGELQQAIGASYEIVSQFSVGLELLHEFVFPEWRYAEKIRNLFVGPNVSYRRGNWFVTVTALAQATDTQDEPDFQLRTIFGMGF